MINPAWTFITGATGYLGSEITLALLDRGHACLLLVRPSSETKARELFEHHIERGRVRLVQGDIASAHCGIATDRIASLPRIRHAVHLAALTRFSGFSYKTMHRINVEGTLHAFELARSLGTASFFHFSTAYVAGITERVLGESELDVGQAFRNDYERTKFEAELALRQVATESRIPITILRPSVVVGDGDGGPAPGRGLFGILDVLHWFKTQLEAGGEDLATLNIRFPGQSELRVNLIALQAVSALFLRIFETRALWGGRYHLVNHEYAELGEVKRRLEKMLKLHGVHLADEPDGKESAETSTALTRLFKRKMRPYFPYFETAPRWRRDGLETAIPDWKKLLAQAHAATFLNGHAEPPVEAGESRWVDQFFERFIPAHVGDRAFREVQTLNDVVGIVIDGVEPRNRLVRFRCGEFEALAPDSRLKPRCVFRFDLPTFRQIVAGEIPPQRAFFEKKVLISGEIFFALKLGSLLEGFFRRNPCRAEERAIP